MSKCRYLCTKLHGVTLQKTKFCSLTTVRVPNLAFMSMIILFLNLIVVIQCILYNQSRLPTVHKYALLVNVTDWFRMLSHEGRLWGYKHTVEARFS